MYKSCSTLSLLFPLGAGFLLVMFGLLLLVNWVAQQLPSLPIIYAYDEKVEVLDIGRGIELELAGDYIAPATFMNITPAISPDKHWIAVENGKDGVRVFDLLRGTRALLPLPFAQPIWSPDSQFVATIPLQGEKDMNIQSNAQWMTIHVADVHSGDVRQVVPAYQYLRIWAMGWSVDSQQITFVAMKSPLPEYTFYSVNRDGSDFHELDCSLSNSGTDQMTNFMFAPGGQQVIFTAKAGKSFHIFALDLSDCNRTQITNSEPYDDLPVWSTNGKQIAFLSGRDGQPDIYVMTPNGGHVSRLTETSDAEMILSWSPDDCCLLYTSFPVGGGITAFHYADLRNNSLHSLDLHHGRVQSLPAWGP